MPNVGNLILLDRQEYREFSLKRKQKKVEKKRKEKISLNKKRRKKEGKKKGQFRLQYHGRCSGLTVN